MPPRGPRSVLWVVVVTANHFIFDAVLGEGGWSQELRPEDSVHTLVAVVTGGEPVEAQEVH